MPKTPLLLSDEKFELYLDLCDEEPLCSMKNRAQRAEYLHFQKGFERWELLHLSETTPKSWRNMLKAHEFNRTPGTPGRPCLLSSESEKLIVERALEAEHNNFALFIKTINELV